MNFVAELLQDLKRPYSGAQRLLAIPGAQALAVVMLLPFTGIYQSMVSSGALNSLTGSLGLGAIVFGGPAAISIVFAKLSANRIQALKLICLIAAVQLPAAAVSGAVATASQAALWVEGFTFLTAIVLWIIAFQIINGSTPSWVPSLLTIGGLLTCLMILNIFVSIGLGNIVVILPGDGIMLWMWSLFMTEWIIIGRSIAAALSGLLLVFSSVVFRSTLLDYVNLRRFKMGSAIALSLIGFDVTGLVSDAPILTIVIISLGLAVELESNGGES